MKDTKNVNQVQISNEFRSAIMKYIKDRNISLDKFCQEINVSKYLISKVINPKIKMFTFESLLKKIASYINYKGEIRFIKKI